MTEFHFVEDYQKLVDGLVAQLPLDQAMEAAVGGAYLHIGKIEADLMRHAGLRDGMALLDLGCGSGRLAHALGAGGVAVDYTGVDIVKALLDYAAAKSPAHFRFVLNRALAVPAPDASLDFICAFSLFTHLLHHETYIYLQDSHRALKRDGKLVFSFLEFAEKTHWAIFESTAEGARNKTLPHLNSFIERDVIGLWASKLGFASEGFIDAGAAVSPAGALGQTTVILRKM
jgi:ubiquinone/menaquinone biosynthesis C-methylase UbiE